MNYEGAFNHGGLRPKLKTSGPRMGNSDGGGIPRKVVVGGILIVALVAFELFNFDTTRYALDYLLGDVRFWGLRWAVILAIAFCAIDFAGLARLFTPEQGGEEPKTVWYLMGAWLLGACMNAVMTWWAVSLTLLTHDFGNEVLSRQQLLEIVPIFVAALVWLTRILFIGALSVAGDKLFRSEEYNDVKRVSSRQRPPSPLPGGPARPRPKMARGAPASAQSPVHRSRPPAASRPLRAREQRPYQRPISGSLPETNYRLQARRRNR